MTGTKRIYCAARYSVACAVSLLLCLPALRAQSSRATLLGQVSDLTGAGVPNAKLTITLIATNESGETSTDETGFFSLPFLPAGIYSVQASAPGFKALKRDRVVLQMDDILTLQFAMELGDSNEKVTVAGGRDELDTSSASRAYRFDPEKLRDLPLIGRQAYSLVGLAPGVIFTQEQFGTTGFAGLRGWDTNDKFIINGGREGTNQFLLNGAPVSLTGRWQFSPSVDSIEEFRVLTNTYDAQFGRTGGGTVLNTLKSGTNDWHGTVFEFAHNAVFDANSTQNNVTGAPRGKHNTHQFGGAIGGPIRKNKDFLFASFESFREIVPFPAVADTPPLDLRDGQHFRKYNIKVYDPLTVHPCVSGVDTAKGVACFGPFIRRQFPGDKIPLSRISPIGQRILSLYPAPNTSGFNQNYVSTGNTSRYRYDQALARWDHSFGEKDRIYGLFAMERGRDFSSVTGFPAAIDVDNRVSMRTDQNYVAEWTHIASPSLVLDLRASFARFTEFFPDGSGDSSLTASSLGITQLPHAPTVDRNAAPRIDLELFNSILGSTYKWSTQNHWDFAPSIIQSRGRHILHYGLEFAYAGLGSAGPGRANGEFSFNRSWTQQYAVRTQDPNRSLGPRDGSAVADLLLGLPASGYINYNDSFYRTWPYYAIFLQDNWKLSRKLSLNLGLRYDVQMPFIERFNRVNAGFDFTTKNPLSDQIVAKWTDLKTQYDAKNPKYPYPDVPSGIYGGRVFADKDHRRPYDTDWTNIQPRLGLAWNFAPKTVFRAGFGIFYRTATQMNQVSGFSQRTNYINSLDGGLTPSANPLGPYSLDDPFPNGIVAPSGASLGPLTDAGRAIVFDGRQRPIPRTYEYSAGFQRQLPWNLFIDVSYAGSQTVHDSFPVQLDAINAIEFSRGQTDPLYLNRTLPNPFVGILPPNFALGSSSQTTAYNLLRPLPLFNGITQTTNPWARYRYDSLQIVAEKRVLNSKNTGIFSFLFAYTFSKSFEASHRLNDWNLAEKPIHELSAFDKPHVLAMSGVWELPIGWGQPLFNGGGRLAGAIKNGWAIDWIFTYNSGYPVNKPNALFSCDSYFAPGGQDANHWFNNDPKCYSARPLYTLQTTEDRFSNIRNPAKPQLHLSVQKTFWITEKYLLQFRGESFNVTNTPIFSGPNTNFRNPRFGQLPLQQNNFPRFIQLAAKLVF